MKSSQLNEKIKWASSKFIELSRRKDIFLVTHFDTDGISSAAIMVQTLRKLDKKFSLKIIKSLEEEFINKIPRDKLVIFLDLASASLHHIKKAGLKDVFIIDHHEVFQEIPKEVTLLNSWFEGKKRICSAGLVYLFCNELISDNSFSKLAVLGMIGDMMEEDIGELGDDIFRKGEIKKIKGLKMYPSTKPLNKVLEYSSSPYIAGVSGNSRGVIELLRNAGIEPINGRYKSLIELSDTEMEKLVTLIALKNPLLNYKSLIGDIFLLKFFNKLEDAREISAMINACSRLGESYTALKFCLELPDSKRRVEEIYGEYKKHLISALEFVSTLEKIEGEDFVIINAQKNIKDTIIGTIATILSTSSLYREGTVITAMAHYENKIKISMRICGNENNGKNAREILERVIKEIGGEYGGHEHAAGGVISLDKEEAFIETLKKSLEIK
ncbi:MAG: DHH family phosphoesterase [Candidatus Pacearchaeota archaeon]